MSVGRRRNGAQLEIVVELFVCPVQSSEHEVKRNDLKLNVYGFAMSVRKGKRVYKV